VTTALAIATLKAMPMIAKDQAKATTLAIALAMAKAVIARTVIAMVNSTVKANEAPVLIMLIVIVMVIVVGVPPLWTARSLV
jgi:hypothetical protein